MPALPPDRRKALLAALRTGLSREAACAKLGIRAKDLEATGKRFTEQVAEAESAGDALIEATLLERGMAGDTQALKMALERRPRLADADLGTGLENLTAAERDAVRRLVEQALAGKVADAVADLNPVERQQRLLAVRQALEGDGVSAQPVVRLVPVGGAQSAEPAAGPYDTGQAAVAAPDAPERREPTYPCGLPVLPGEPDCPHCHGPDRDAERPRGTVIAPSDWIN